MKKAIFLLVAVMLISVSNLFSQDFPYETFKSSKVTYLGLDYTHARFVDDLAFTSPDELVSKFFKTWNHMLIVEPDKYDFKKFTDKSTAIIDLNMMDERNSKVDVANVVQNDFFELKQNEIPQIVRGMDFGALDGIAVFFVVGTYNKNAAIASYFLVLFDIDQDEIIYTKKYVTKPSGFGFKNYWARTYYEVLLQLEKDNKKKWSKGKN